MEGGAKYGSYIESIKAGDEGFSVAAQYVCVPDARRTNPGKGVFRSFTPIFYAIYYNNVHAFDLLYQKEKYSTNADLVQLEINGALEKLQPGSTVLQFGIMMRNEQVVSYIFQDNDERLIHGQNNQNIDTLMLLCKNNLSKYINRSLVQRHLMYSNKCGQNCLHYCCYFGAIDSLMRIVDIVMEGDSIESKMVLYRQLMQRDIQEQTPAQICMERMDQSHLDETIIENKRKCSNVISGLLNMLLTDTNDQTANVIRQDAIIQAMLGAYMDSY